MELEEENQCPGGTGTAVTRNIDYTPNQCKMLTGLGSRKSRQPNCVSWALPVSRCYYSYMQINKHWAEIKSRRQAEDGWKKKASAQAAHQSGEHYHKHKKPIILHSLFQFTGALLRKKKNLPEFCFITKQLFFQVLVKPPKSLSWLA